MMLEELKIGNETIAYKTSIQNTHLSIDEMVKHIEQNVLNSSEVKNDAYSLNKNDEKIFYDILKTGTDICQNLAKKDGIRYNTTYTDFWFNIIRVDSSEIKQANAKVYTIEKANYHIHYNLNVETGKFIPKYTFVYYIQLPNNCIDNEGALLLKNKNEEVYVFNPNINDMIIFDAKIPHGVLGSRNTNLKRIVLAGCVGFKNSKVEKSIL